MGNYKVKSKGIEGGYEIVRTKKPADEILVFSKWHDAKERALKLSTGLVSTYTAFHEKTILNLSSRRPPRWEKE